MQKHVPSSVPLCCRLCTVLFQQHFLGRHATRCAPGHYSGHLACQVYFFDDHTGNAAEMAEFGFNGREARRSACVIIA